MDEPLLVLCEVWVLQEDSGFKLGAVEEADEQKLLELFSLHLLVVSHRQHEKDNQAEAQHFSCMRQKVNQVINA